MVCWINTKSLNEAPPEQVFNWKILDRLLRAMFGGSVWVVARALMEALVLITIVLHLK
jgi:hypothetical protein